LQVIFVAANCGKRSSSSHALLSSLAENPVKNKHCVSNG